MLRNFKFFFQNLLCLRKKHKNDDKSEGPDFYESTLYMIFAIFLKIPENFWKSYIGWIRKNSQIYSCQPFYNFLQKWPFSMTSHGTLAAKARESSPSLIFEARVPVPKVVA